ncbi:MAG TPA: hypothetical protein VFH64_11490 [Amnibacterium sp.]|nr:hypothetical protein [Amnibacterium sp.]
MIDPADGGRDGPAGAKAPMPRLEPDLLVALRAPLAERSSTPADAKPQLGRPR